MTRNELAQQLYGLVVVAGRANGSRTTPFPNGWGGLPEYIRDMWRIEAGHFADKYNFFLEDE